MPTSTIRSFYAKFWEEIVTGRVFRYARVTSNSSTMRLGKMGNPEIDHCQRRSTGLLPGGRPLGSYRAARPVTWSLGEEKTIDAWVRTTPFFVLISRSSKCSRCGKSRAQTFSK